MASVRKQKSSKKRSSKGGLEGIRRARKKRFPRLGRQRRQANERERTRAQRITEAIEDLRCFLWKEEEDRDGRTKPIIQTLLTAMDYIKLLKKIADEEELSSEETNLPAFSLLDRYCKNDLLTTRAQPRVISQDRPDSLELCDQASSSTSNPNSLVSSTTSSSGYSSCSAELWTEIGLALSCKDPDPCVEDQFLSDICKMSEFTDWTQTSTFDLDFLLNPGPCEKTFCC